MLSQPRRHSRWNPQPPQRDGIHGQVTSSPYELPASKRVRQRALRCGILASVFGVCHYVSQTLQSSMLPSCLPARKLSAALSSRISGVGGPPTPGEFLGMSIEAKSNMNKMVSSRPNHHLLRIPRTPYAAVPSRPTFLLYAGVPEHSFELQCRICKDPQLRDALDRDGYVFLGTCPKSRCEDYETSTNATSDANGDDSDETRVFSPRPSNFFTSSNVNEYTSSNTTLGILPHTLAMSLAHGRRRNIPQLEVDFMLTLDRLRIENRNAILIHPGASTWSARHIRSLSAFLNLHWDVHVLVGPYQPFLEYVSEISYRFVTTEYLESRTFRLWPGQKRGDRVGFDSLEGSTVGDVKLLVEENLPHGMHPLEMVWSNYARHFGRDRTHFVIPALPKEDTGIAGKDGELRPPLSALARAHLLGHLICDTLGLARSCRRVKELQQREKQHQLSHELRDDPASRWTQELAEIWEVIQVDAVAVEAYYRHVEAIQSSNFSTGAAPYDWARVSARGQIWSRLDSLGQSPLKDWPRICLPKDSLEALTDYSKVLHDRILRLHDEGRNATRAPPYGPKTESFVTDVLLCHVDAIAVVEDEKWAGWFQEGWASEGTAGADGAASAGGESDEAEEAVSSSSITLPEDGTDRPVKADGGVGILR